MGTESDTDRLASALRLLGSSKEARALVVDALRAAEPFLAEPDRNVRVDITGPLVDAMYTEGERVDIRLNTGLAYSAIYTTSHITRDLVLRPDAEPDHVFEPQTTKTLLALSKNAKHVIIGGAYSGDHAIPIAAQIAPHGGIVHAFEPNPDQQAMLRANAAANGLTNIRGIQKGLWDMPNVRLSFVGTDALASTTLDPNGSIEVTTIDDYCREAGVAQLDLIMIDIEGSELQALRGGRGTLAGATPPAVVFEMNRQYVDWTDGLRKTTLGALFDELGFTIYGIRDYQSHVAMPDYPVELVPADTAYIGGPRHGFNMLAVKDPAIVEDPLFRIVPDVSPKLLHHRDPALHAPKFTSAAGSRPDHR